MVCTIFLMLIKVKIPQSNKSHLTRPLCRIIDEILQSLKRNFNIRFASVTFQLQAPVGQWWVECRPGSLTHTWSNSETQFSEISIYVGWIKCLHKRHRTPQLNRQKDISNQKAVEKCIKISVQPDPDSQASCLQVLCKQTTTWKGEGDRWGEESREKEAGRQRERARKKEDICSICCVCYCSQCYWYEVS